MKVNLNPKEDGITHINIYSKGKTELGRILSNFYYMALHTSFHGGFCCIEGYWYWLKSRKSENDKVGCKELRTAVGYKAKQVGRLNIASGPNKKGNYIEDEEKFKNYIIKAMELKSRNSIVENLIQESVLPFAHYYVFSGQAKYAGYEWIVQEWERIRREIKNEPNS